MTEDEAREKWCPMVRATDIYTSKRYEHGCNRVPGNGFHDPFKCIASDCMMWRCPLSDETAGYCGLAGSKFIYVK